MRKGHVTAPSFRRKRAPFSKVFDCHTLAAEGSAQIYAEEFFPVFSWTDVGHGFFFVKEASYNRILRYLIIRHFCPWTGYQRALSLRIIVEPFHYLICYASTLLFEPKFVDETFFVGRSIKTI